MLFLRGPDLRWLMRIHQCPIRALAARLAIPMTRIRAVRSTGLTCPYSARDWLEAITGTDPGPLDQPWRRESDHE